MQTIRGFVFGKSTWFLTIMYFWISCRDGFYCPETLLHVVRTNVNFKGPESKSRSSSKAVNLKIFKMANGIHQGVLFLHVELNLFLQLCWLFPLGFHVYLPIVKMQEKHNNVILKCQPLQTKETNVNSLRWTLHHL